MKISGPYFNENKIKSLTLSKYGTQYLPCRSVSAQEEVQEEATTDQATADQSLNTLEKEVFGEIFFENQE